MKRQTVISVLVFVVLGLGFWLARIAFEDRHWKEYRGAGLRALERGHHEWAEKMHLKALKEARNLGNDPLIARSLVDLSRVYNAQGRDELAVSLLARARTLQSGNP